MANIIIIIIITNSVNIIRIVAFCHRNPFIYKITLSSKDARLFNDIS